MAKAWVAFIGAIITGLTAAFADDIFNIDDVQQLAIVFVPALATLYSTYQTSNMEHIDG